MSNITKPWFPYMGPYDGKFPPYYDLNGVAWYDKLKQDLPAIKENIVAFLKKDGLLITENSGSVVKGEGAWKQVPFMFWNVTTKLTKNTNEELFRYFKNIPGMVSLGVSILQPKTRLDLHSGDTDAVYRVHMPIYIPAQLPDCGIKVGGISKPWAENDMVVFCDAHFHEAWNMTNEPRIVLIMDVIKEEFLPQADEICATVMAYMKYEGIAGRFKFAEKLAKASPLWVRNIVRAILKLIPIG